MVIGIISEFQNRDSGALTILLNQKALHPIRLCRWKQSVQRVQVKRNRYQPASDLRQNLVLIRPPVCKARQILPYPGTIGMEDVRSVLVDKDAILVWTIIGITPNVITLLQNENLLVQAHGKSFSDRNTTESGTDNQAVNLDQDNTSEYGWTWELIHRVLSSTTPYLK